MIQIFASILSIIVIVLLIFKYEYGVALFIALMFIMPIFTLYLFGVRIGWNLVTLIILILYFVHYRKTIQIWQIFPFLFILLAQGLLIPFHFSDEPVIYQLNMLRIDLMSLILPFVVINISVQNKNYKKLFGIFLYCAIIVNVLYGVSLLTTPGQNIYVDSLDILANWEETDQEAILDEGIRIFGYISGCFKSATQFGSFLVFSLIYVIFDILNSNGIKKIALGILIGLISILIMFCGARTALYTSIIAICFFLILRRKIKSFLIIIFIAIAAYVSILYFIPDYIGFILSIGDENIQGSTIGMRITQLKGCIESISDNFLVGNGFDWTHWYRTEIGRHPVMLSFESLLIMILCNNGLIGLFFWLLYIVIYILTCRKVCKNDSTSYIILITLFFAFFVYAMMTGDYGCSSQLFVFYSFILAQNVSIKYRFKVIDKNVR